MGCMSIILTPFSPEERVSRRKVNERLEAVRSALEAGKTGLSTHTGNKNNPHNVTAKQIGAEKWELIGNYTKTYREDTFYSDWKSSSISVTFPRIDPKYNQIKFEAYIAGSITLAGNYAPDFSFGTMNATRMTDIVPNSAGGPYNFDYSDNRIVEILTKNKYIGDKQRGDLAPVYSTIAPNGDPYYVNSGVNFYLTYDRQSMKQADVTCYLRIYGKE